MDTMKLHLKQCPLCGLPLREYVCDDSDIYEDEEVMIFSGSCDHCDKEFGWTEVFRFAEVSDAEIIEEDDW